MWVRLETGYGTKSILSVPKARRAATSIVTDEKTGEIISSIDYIIPYWVAIINLHNGIPQSIQWDDGCFTCKGDSCINETCGVNINDCFPYKDGSQIDCDLKVYIAWFGTDNNGNYLTSAGKVPSRFQEYSVSSAVSSAAFQAYDQVPNAPEFSGNNAADDHPNGDLPSD